MIEFQQQSPVNLADSRPVEIDSPNSQTPRLLKPMLPLVNLVSNARGSIHGKLFLGFLVIALLVVWLAILNVVSTSRIINQAEDSQIILQGTSFSAGEQTAQVRGQLALQAKERITQENETMARLVVGASAVALVLAFLCGLVFSWVIIRPVKQIVAGLNSIAAGNFDFRMNVSNKDEFGMLANRINSMAERLGETYAELNSELDKRKSAEQALVVANSSLEARIDERTKELEEANSKLMVEIEERKLLEEQFLRAQKLEAVARLAGGVAHDFNNLLTPVSLYADLGAGTDCPPDKSRMYFEEIGDAAKKASDVSRQLLSFSRSRVMEKEVVDPNVVINNVSKLLRRVLGDDVELVLELEPQLGHVELDKGQAEQVLMNLVVNARDALPDGGRITIRTFNLPSLDSINGETPDAGAFQQVVITITDNGTGMSEEVKAHIFEPFFTTKDESKGTGLGLATSYGIVQQSGGEITVESEPGKGSTFRILLPVVDKVADDKSAAVDQRSLTGDEVVLLVEDNDSVRSAAAVVLRTNGYTVIEASNAAEGIAQLKQARGQEIDLVLTDVSMPEVSGPDMMAQIEQFSPGSKVLFMSGFLDPDKYESLPTIAPFIQKPFTMRDLAIKVRDVLDGVGTEPAREAP